MTPWRAVRLWCSCCAWSSRCWSWLFHRVTSPCPLRLWRAWARRRSWVGSRCWMRPWRLCRSCSRSWSWCWRSAAAQPRHGHRIGRTTSAGGDFAYHQHEGLAVFDVKRERCRVTRNWALPFVCYPLVQMLFGSNVPRYAAVKMKLLPWQSVLISTVTH
jgi:hypothetical protein